MPSLPSPSPDVEPEVAGQADAVWLFVERARAVDPDFSLTGENTAAVIQICRRLDGVLVYPTDFNNLRVLKLVPGADAPQGVPQFTGTQDHPFQSVGVAVDTATLTSTFTNHLRAICPQKWPRCHDVVTTAPKVAAAARRASSWECA